MLPTIYWKNNQVVMIDQRKLPARIEWCTCRTYQEVIRAIQKMIIRGAPAIGIAAAMGLALGARAMRADSYHSFLKQFQALAAKIALARPTAVNLQWAVDRMLLLAANMQDCSIVEIKKALMVESQKILVEDIAINQQIGRHGQKLVPGRSVILTHCNAGSLATGGYGTALGVIRAAHAAGKQIAVIADETRPWLQGLRLTAFELMQDNIPVTVIADNAAGALMRQKKIDLVITGADRIAQNGDVANKIGTYQLAVLAKENRIPFYVAAPVSTIDLKIRCGNAIPVEERAGQEISHLGDRCLGPAGVKTFNPAFDVTPAKYVRAIITERGIIRPPYAVNIKKYLK
jgi:methylthioribose-1-phosphate isomerase